MICLPVKLLIVYSLKLEMQGAHAPSNNTWNVPCMVVITVQIKGL